MMIMLRLLSLIQLSFIPLSSLGHTPKHKVKQGPCERIKKQEMYNEECLYMSLLAQECQNMNLRLLSLSSLPLPCQRNWQKCAISTTPTTARRRQQKSTRLPSLAAGSFFALSPSSATKLGGCWWAQQAASGRPYLGEPKVWRVTGILVLFWRSRLKGKAWRTLEVAIVREKNSKTTITLAFQARLMCIKKQLAIIIL